MSLQATTAEREAFKRLMAAPENEQLARELIYKAYATNPDTADVEQPVRDAILKAIYQSATDIPAAATIRPESRRSIRWLPAAAAILVFVLAGTWFFFNSRNSDNSADIVNAKDVGPGRNRATLTLADGTTIDLSTDQSGIVAGSGSITYDDGSPLDKTGLNPKGQYAILHTPRGGQYKVTLPDGSEIWLNAASSLKYPVKFTGSKERKVELVGEAYFEIAEDAAHPFIVTTGQQQVKVLGTQFNINAYKDEQAVRTTLVEGRIQVTSDGSSLQLLPGEQGTFVNNSLRKSSVDVSAFTAWRNGRFNFDGKGLEQVMRELSRWYDIEVVYEGPVPAIEFFGGIHRNSNLSTVLNILETNEIRYRLEAGRRLVISAK